MKPQNPESETHVGKLSSDYNGLYLELAFLREAHRSPWRVDKPLL
jgi:hypothetical protein